MSRLALALLLLIGCSGERAEQHPNAGVTPPETPAVEAPPAADARDDELSRLRKRVARLELQRDASDEAATEAGKRLATCEQRLQAAGELVATMAKAISPGRVQPVAPQAQPRPVTRPAPRSASEDVRNYSGPYVLPQGDTMLVRGVASNFGTIVHGGDLVVEFYYEGRLVDSARIGFELAPGEDLPWDATFDNQGEGIHEAQAWIED